MKWFRSWSIRDVDAWGRINSVAALATSI